MPTLRDSSRATRTFAVFVAVSLCIAGSAALAAPGSIVLASTSDAGTKGNRESREASLSGGGTIVAFRSKAANLDPLDTDAKADIYVKNLASGDMTVASSSDSREKGNGPSIAATISSDGTRVAFSSRATNLDPADRDALWDIYVKDLTTGDIALASRSDEGDKGNGISTDAFISPDGTAVGFQSKATNLHPSDTDAVADIYVKDLLTGDITLVSTSDSGEKGNGNSTGPPSLSEDRTKVAFRSQATNLDPADRGSTTDAYVKNLSTGDIMLVSTSDAGEKANGPSGGGVALSADGRKVVFRSSGTNLDPNDKDTLYDIYVKDLSTGDTTLVSTSDAGEKANASCYDPSISTDGSIIAFSSFATNLDPGDTDPVLDIFVKQVASGNLTLASTSENGTKGNQYSYFPSLSADATKVSFRSDSTNLVQADTDRTGDIYVKELP